MVMMAVVIEGHTRLSFPVSESGVVNVHYWIINECAHLLDSVIWSLEYGLKLDLVVRSRESIGTLSDSRINRHIVR
jgi:hypothetical protein